MRTLVTPLLLAIALAIGTWILGWWAVPLLGAVWGLMQRGRPRFVAPFMGAALAWAALLAFDGTHGALGRTASVLGGIFGMPGPVLLVVTLLFAGLLAGCAAEVTGAWPSRRRALYEA